MDHIERLHWIAQRCFALAGEKQGTAAENLRNLGREYQDRAAAAADRRRSADARRASCHPVSATAR